MSHWTKYRWEEAITQFNELTKNMSPELDEELAYEVSIVSDRLASFSVELEKWI